MKKIILSLLMLSSVLPIATLYAGADDNTLVIYSGRSDKFVKPLLEKFTEKTGIKVQLYNAPAASLLNKLILEKDRTLADVFISNDAGTLQVGQSKGLFRALPEKIVAPIAKQYRANDNTWVGLSGRARVMVVNTQNIDPNTLHSIRDLADATHEGKIAITSSANGSFIAGTSVYLLKMGEQETLKWLKGIKKNSGGRSFNKHSRIVKAVANGEYDIGLINHYYFFRHIAKHPDAPIALLIPDQDGMGVAWNVAGIAISKYTQQGSAAERLVEYLTSKEGQALFASVNKEFPTRSDVQLSKSLEQLGRIKVADVPMSELGKQRSSTLDIIEKSGLQ